MTQKFKDIAGKIFGNWTVINRVGATKNGTALWLCRCLCGTERSVKSSRLISGNSKSCGCLQKEIAAAQETTHGMSKTNIYKLWCSMRARCNNRNNANYFMYGGRGIKVCSRWDMFENFYADMAPRPSGATIERIDNNGDYSPDNCRWATPFEQGQNKRNNRTFEVHGVSYTLSAISRRFGIAISTFQGRIDRGWSTEDAATSPIIALHRNNK